MPWLAWECRIQWVHVDEFGCDEELPPFDEQLPAQRGYTATNLMKNSRATDC